MLDQAFEALKTYDWGQDANVLAPIDEAVVAAHDDPAACGELEDRLAGVLKTDVPYDAKQYVCRKLMRVGSADCVPVLAELLPDAKLSHMARYALERIPAKEAGQALRDALGKVDGELKVGVIGSLGVRGEADSVAPLKVLLNDSDPAIANSAAHALGAIRSADAGQALASAKSAEGTKAAVADATLACAESLLADGDRAAALMIYKRLLGNDPSQNVRVAATRGMLACAGQKESS